jgi:hypothetical protein
MLHGADYLARDIYIIYRLVRAVIAKPVEWLRRGLEQPRFISRQIRDFFITQNFRTDSMAHPALYSTYMERYFPGGKAIGVRKWIFTSIYWRG